MRDPRNLQISLDRSSTGRYTEDGKLNVVTVTATLTASSRTGGETLDLDALERWVKKARELRIPGDTLVFAGSSTSKDTAYQVTSLKALFSPITTESEEK